MGREIRGDPGETEKGNDLPPAGSVGVLGRLIDGLPAGELRVRILTESMYISVFSAYFMY